MPVEFDVQARDAEGAAHVVEAMIEEALHGPSENEDRTQFDDAGWIIGVRGWKPIDVAPDEYAAPSPGWLPYLDSGIPEMVAEMFPAEPDPSDYRRADGTIDGDALEDVRAQWRDQSLELAVQASHLPDLLARMIEAEQFRSSVRDLVAESRLPVEPVKSDYLVTVSPAYEGEFEDMRYRWDRTQWQSSFNGAARDLEAGLLRLVDGTTSSPKPGSAAPGMLPADLFAVQILRTLASGGTSAQGSLILDRTQRARLAQMLFASDHDIAVTDPTNPGGAALYEGPASQAHQWLPAGSYEATGVNRKGQFRLVIDTNPLDETTNTSAAFSPLEHDSQVLDEVARLLEQHSEHASPEVVLGKISAVVTGTGRTGAPGNQHPDLGRDRPPTRLEQGLLLSDLLADRAQRLAPDPTYELPAAGEDVHGRDL